MMNTFRAVLLPVVLLAGLCGCDCAISGTGYVYDAATGEPLVGATAALVGTDESGLADSSGYFDLYYTTGICPAVRFRITQPGYKPLELELDNDGDEVVYRLRAESVDVPLDPPFYPSPRSPDSFISRVSFDRYSQRFSVGALDTLSFFLERDDPAAELEAWKARMREGWSR